MKEIRNEIVNRLETLIKAKKKGYKVVFITKYAGSYYLYLLDDERPYANMQVFESLYSDNTLELNINKIEFKNCYPTSDRLKELEDICERVSKEYNELPNSLIVSKKALEPYADMFDYLQDTFGFTCESYKENFVDEKEIEIKSIKWLVQIQLESEKE